MVRSGAAHVPLPAAAGSGSADDRLVGLAGEPLGLAVSPGLVRGDALLLGLAVDGRDAGEDSGVGAAVGAVAPAEPPGVYAATTTDARASYVGVTIAVTTWAPANPPKTDSATMATGHPTIRKAASRFSGVLTVLTMYAFPFSASGLAAPTR
jgi:hypothetical protein